MSLRELPDLAIPHLVVESEAGEQHDRSAFADVLHEEPQPLLHLYVRHFAG